MSLGTRQVREKYETHTESRRKIKRANARRTTASIFITRSNVASNVHLEIRFNPRRFLRVTTNEPGGVSGENFVNSTCDFVK